MKRDVDLSLLPDITVSQLQQVALAFGLRLEVALDLGGEPPVQIDLTTVQDVVLAKDIPGFGSTGIDGEPILPCEMPGCELHGWEDGLCTQHRYRPCPGDGCPIFGKVGHAPHTWTLAEAKAQSHASGCFCSECVKRDLAIVQKTYDEKVSEFVSEVVVPEVERLEVASAAPEPLEGDQPYVTCMNPECRKEIVQSPIGRKRLYCDGKCKSRSGVLRGTKKSGTKKSVVPAPTAPTPVVARPSGLCGRCDSPEHHVEDCPEPLVRRKKAAEVLATPPVPKVETIKERAARVQEEHRVQGLTCGRCKEKGHSIFTCTKGEEGKAHKVTGDEVTDTELAASGVELMERFRRGMNLGYVVHDDVMALYGVDLDLVEGVLREPEQVSVRPESFNKEKRYVVLSFKRGDLEVILGTRNLREPMVIAVYASSRLEADTHHVNHAGGGGSKAASGLPKTPTQMASRLRALGCEVSIDSRQDTAEVTYKGQSLGKVSTKPDRSTVESDYQRMVRKVDGANRAVSV